MPASTAAGQAVYQEGSTNALQHRAYFRIGLKITYRLARRRLSHTWFLDLQNLTDYQNVFSQRWDRKAQRITTEYQLGLLPNIQYRLLF